MLKIGQRIHRRVFLAQNSELRDLGIYSPTNTPGPPNLAAKALNQRSQTLAECGQCVIQGFRV